MSMVSSLLSHSRQSRCCHPTSSDGPNDNLLHLALSQPRRLGADWGFSLALTAEEGRATYRDALVGMESRDE